MAPSPVTSAWEEEEEGKEEWKEWGGEEVCRAVLEEQFSQNFNNSQPSFLTEQVAASQFSWIWPFDVKKTCFS